MRKTDDYSETVHPNGRHFGRVARTVMFAGVVDSVRLVEADEEGAVRGILATADRIAREVLPRHGGRLVKRLGDGLMAEFDDPAAAVRAARDCLDACGTGAPVQLRVGLHAGEVLSVGGDLLGRAVNVAARILSLARPGELVATAEVKDATAGRMDLDFEDLGDCHLRNLAAPVRVWRLSPPGSLPRLRPMLDEADLLPTVAVLPLRPAPRREDAEGIGEVIAEEIIVALSRSGALNVTSRLSTSAAATWGAPLARLGEALGAQFVLSGSFAGGAERLTVDLELAEVRSGRVLWATRLRESFEALIHEPEAVDEIVASVQGAVVQAEVRRARSRPPPTLESHALLTAATSLMHRPSARDFALAETLLRNLMERAGELPAAMSAMARWHVLRVTQGWTDDPQREGREALRLTRDALAIDPDDVAALVSEGFVLTNLIHRLDEAEARYDAALDLCPNEPTGRLLRGVLHAFRGEGAKAVRDAERAMHLAPRDPHRYLFESLAASACIAAGDDARALALATQSLRSNRGHTSRLRVKAVAEVRLGRGEAARATVRELLARQPGLTVSGWLGTAPSKDYPVGREFARSPAEAGVPA